MLKVRVLGHQGLIKHGGIQRVVNSKIIPCATTIPTQSVRLKEALRGVSTQFFVNTLQRS